MVVTFTHTVWGLISLLYMDLLGPPSLVPFNPLPPSGNSPSPPLASPCQSRHMQIPSLSLCQTTCAPFLGSPREGQEGGRSSLPASSTHTFLKWPSSGLPVSGNSCGFCCCCFVYSPWAGTGTQNLERPIQVLDLPLLPK